MRSKQEIKYRAIQMGIATGTMPDLELMWWIQRDDQHVECFGRISGCSEADCPLRYPCRHFMSFTETKNPDVRFVPLILMPGKTG